MSTPKSWLPKLIFILVVAYLIMAITISYRTIEKREYTIQPAPNSASMPTLTSS